MLNANMTIGFGDEWSEEGLKPTLDNFEALFSEYTSDVGLLWKGSR